MHPPVQLIEDMCVLDQLLEGRLDYGVGRGAVPIQHYWFGDSWPHSRERFVDVLGIVRRALDTGEISSEGSQFYDFPAMPMSTRPFQERIPFWYPGNPVAAGQYGLNLMWPGKIEPAAYEAYVDAWNRHKDDELRFDGPDSEPRVAYNVILAIAPTEDEAQEIARRGMEGLVRRTRNAHRFDRLVISEEECEAAQGPLRAILSTMEPAISFGAGTTGQIAERLAGMLEDGLSDYICFMLPTGDMTLYEARRTLDLFVTEVKPQLDQVTV
jgi:alkanesulfonate monooxygenase SsuD/methylene tetrahydromethanopterin reductase-like flavin-dependent oxidoreductase (luciferase family)